MTISLRIFNLTGMITMMTTCCINYRDCLPTSSFPRDLTSTQSGSPSPSRSLMEHPPTSLSKKTLKNSWTSCSTVWITPLNQHLQNISSSQSSAVRLAPSSCALNLIAVKWKTAWKIITICPSQSRTSNRSKTVWKSKLKEKWFLDLNVMGVTSQ